MAHPFNVRPRSLVAPLLFGLFALHCGDETTLEEPDQGPPELWETDGLESPVANVLNTTGDLCAIALDCGSEIEDEPKIACRMAVREGDSIVYDSLVGIEQRGRSSQNYPKKNYGLELRHEDRSNNPTDLLGMGTDEDWILDGSWLDRSFMRNQMASELFASFSTDNYAAEARYCTLVLNGDPQGIYRLVERPKRKQSRVALPADDGSGQSFLIRQGRGGPLRFELGLEREWELSYPRQRTATNQQLDGIQKWLTDFDKALRSGDPEDRQTGPHSFLNRASLVDWILIQEFAKNIDAYKLSVHFYKDSEGPARLIPWDFDLSFGQPTVQAWDADSPEEWSYERTEFLQVLLSDPTLQDALTDRWRELRQGPMSEENVLARLDGHAQTLATAADANFAIWPIDEITFEPIYPPYKMAPVGSFENEVSLLRQWMSERLQWMDDNIDEFL